MTAIVTNFIQIAAGWPSQISLSGLSGWYVQKQYQAFTEGWWNNEEMSLHVPHQKPAAEKQCVILFVSIVSSSLVWFKTILSKEQTHILSMPFWDKHWKQLYQIINAKLTIRHEYQSLRCENTHVTCSYHQVSSICSGWNNMINDQTWNCQVILLLVGGFHHLKKTSQLGNLPQIGVNIKHIFELPKSIKWFRIDSPSS